MKKILCTLYFVLFIVSIYAADTSVRPSRSIPSNTSANLSPIRVEANRVSRAAVSRGVVDSNSTKEVNEKSQDRPIRRAVSSASKSAPSASPPAVVSRSAVSRAINTVSSENSGRSGAPAIQSRNATTRINAMGLRPSTAEVGGRAVIGRTNVMTGSNIDERMEEQRGTTRRARAAVETAFTVDSSTAEAPSPSEDLAACTEGYFDCLNQFCNVLDANQKQCSCSGRLTQYKKVEESLQKANDELNNVANQIRYVGLSADEVRSIMKETEAEAVLGSVDDRTQSRQMLEEIERLIISPTGDFGGGTSSSSLDFELDFSSGDAFSLDGLFGNSNSFANMRGTELYNAAKKKCSPILARCATKKSDQSVISGQYDIEIDKACIAYEAGLKKATANVKTNVRSATQMLQKARLAVLADHNTYDAKGCVAALDECMRDDMVCGGNYYKCLDPTKTAIDESGKIIPGGDVAKIKELISQYDSSCLSNDAYKWTEASGTDCNTGTTTSMCGISNGVRAANKNDGRCVISYIVGKIGKADTDGKIKSGFCRPVLDKCRQFTYSNGQYVEDNTIVRSYVERVMTQVKAAQSSIMAEYASTCIHDVSTCYNSQITQVNSYTSGMNISPAALKPILLGACRNVALSCAYAVFAADRESSGKCPGGDTTTCINNLSEMFYQSMLCPANSTWDENGGTPSGVNNTKTTSTNKAFINSNCYCNLEYYVNNNQCVASPICPTGSNYDSGSDSTKNGSDADNAVPVPYCKCIHVGPLLEGNACPKVAATE